MATERARQKVQEVADVLDVTREVLYAGAASGSCHPTKPLSRSAGSEGPLPTHRS